MLMAMINSHGLLHLIMVIVIYFHKSLIVLLVCAENLHILFYRVYLVMVVVSQT